MLWPWGYVCPAMKKECLYIWPWCDRQCTVGMVLQRKFPFVFMVIQLINNLEPLYWRFFPPQKTHTISSAAVIIIWRNQYLIEKSLTIICGKSISFLVVLMKMKILKKKRCMHYAYTSNALPLFFWVFTECWVLNCA